MLKEAKMDGEEGGYADFLLFLLDKNICYALFDDWLWPMHGLG